MLELVVITISDRASRGEYSDRSGPEIKRILEESGVSVKVTMSLIPDDSERIEQELRNHVGVDWVITTGGTGIGPRDHTPEVTAVFCDRMLPGVQEMLRRESAEETPFAVFSRGLCGVRGETLVINFPGSVAAVRLCTSKILPLLEHGPRMARGEGH